MDELDGVGDDVVDLSVVNPPLHPRFAERVFTPDERRWIRGSWKLLWLHWAAKEAAFKAYSRFLHKIPFSPKRYVVNLNRAEVHTPFGKAYFQSILSNELVYVRCVTAGLKDSRRLISWIGKRETDSNGVAARNLSTLVREMARRKISEVFSIPLSSVSVASCNRAGWSEAPVLNIGNRRSESLLSFSHHGRFYSFTLKR